jgi:hypothetical protein
LCPTARQPLPVVLGSFFQNGAASRVWVRCAKTPFPPPTGVVWTGEEIPFRKKRFFFAFWRKLVHFRPRKASAVAKNWVRFAKHTFFACVPSTTSKSRPAAGVAASERATRVISRQMHLRSHSISCECLLIYIESNSRVGRRQHLAIFERKHLFALKNFESRRPLLFR